ncbi:hypothetical protein [Salinibacter grassmerensis]|uniref:hypothetical protein n=1 Tax=Salinibacter grassmerensis TaxID=3040353 RepID=UPI0021E7579D|nr:hypothetical protein [Salinibacter grassmerensis]
MPDGRPPYRQYAGLAFVILTYVGGIIGWSCAVQQAEPASPPENSAQVQAVPFGSERWATPPPAAVDSGPPCERSSSSGHAPDRRSLSRLSYAPTNL